MPSKPGGRSSLIGNGNEELQPHDLFVVDKGVILPAKAMTIIERMVRRRNPVDEARLDKGAR